MRDERGFYYHAEVGNPRARVYVRRSETGEIEFRMWEATHPEVWEKHQWLPMSVIREAAKLYQTERDPKADPCKLYDESIAKALLQEQKI